MLSMLGGALLTVFGMYLPTCQMGAVI